MIKNLNQKLGKHMQDDIRWKQRFYNYQKAIVQLTKFIEKGE